MGQLSMGEAADEKNHVTYKPTSTIVPFHGDMH